MNRKRKNRFGEKVQDVLSHHGVILFCVLFTNGDHHKISHRLETNVAHTSPEKKSAKIPERQIVTGTCKLQPHPKGRHRQVQFNTGRAWKPFTDTPARMYTRIDTQTATLVNSATASLVPEPVAILVPVPPHFQ